MKKEKHPKIKTALSISITVFKTLFFISLFATIVFLIILAVWHYNNNISNKSTTYIDDTIKDIATILTCITASFSLFVASLVRHESAKNRIIDKEIAINQKWYNSLIIDRHLDETLKFFSGCINNIDDLKLLNESSESLSIKEYNSKCKAKIVLPFTSAYTKVQYGMVSDILIIDNDVSAQIDKLFQTFQDNFLIEIDKKTPDYNKMKREVYSTRKELLIILKQFDLSYIPQK